MQRRGAALAVSLMFFLFAGAAFTFGSGMSVTNGLRLWLKADAIAGVGDGDAVTSWPDASGLGNDFSQTNAAAQPAYVLDAVGGQPVVRFGNDDVLDRGDALGFSGNPAMTVINVINGPAGVSERYFQIGATNNTASNSIAFCSDAGLRYNNGNDLYLNDCQTGGFSVGVWTREAGDDYDDSHFYKDGVAGIQSGQTNPDYLPSVSNENASVGAGLSDAGSYTDFFTGDIGELLVYDRVLTPAEINAVGAYLEEKYGLDTRYSATATPADVDGLALWLDAARIGGGIADGQTVTVWADMSGNRNDATNAAGPKYVASAVGGRPAVSFEGAETLYTGALTADWPTNNASIFVVSKADAENNAERLLLAQPTVNANAFRVNVPYNGRTIFDFGENVAPGRLETTFNGGTSEFNVWFMRSEDGVGQRIYMNGMLQTSDTDTDTYDPTGQYLEIGGATTACFNGDVAEVIIYNRALTASEQQAVGYYLEAKYGLRTVYPDPESEPMRVGGVRLWLDYEAMPGMSNGVIPAVVYDSSGYEHDLALSDGGPTCRDTGINGHMFMDYGGGGAFTRSADGLGFTGNPAISVAVVMKSDDASTDRFLQIGGTAGANYTVMSWLSEASCRYNNGSKLFNEDFSGDVCVGIFTRKAGDRYDAVRLFKNGRESGQLSAASGANLLSLLDEKVTIGRGWSTTGGASDWYAGEMYELIVFDKELSYEEQEQVGSYFAAKYGIETSYSGDIDAANFAHRMNIAFPGYDRSETLTNFPVLVTLGEGMDGFSYAQMESPAGYDLRFTDAEGTTVLAHDIDEWAAAPVAAWSFNDSLGDVSVVGNGYAGTIHGGVTYTSSTPDGNGKAAAFNGTDAYVSISGNKGVLGNAPRTMSAWIRQAGPEEGIMGWGTDSPGQKWNMRADVGNGALRVDVNDGYVIGTTSLTNTADTAWHHVAAVFPEGAEDVTDVRLYVDGVRETISGSLAKLIDTASDVDLRIGVGNNARYFSGQIDEVAVYDRALTDGQIAQIYASGGVSADTGARLNGGVSTVWVKIPELARGTTIQALWGNAAIAGLPPFSDLAGQTWTEGFEGVWHMESASTDDATEYGRDTAAGGNAAVADGPLNSVVSYGADGDYSQAIGYKGILGTASRTVSAWIKKSTTVAADNDADIMSWGKNTGEQKWVFRVQDDNYPGPRNLRVEVNGGYKVATADLGDSQWHHVAVVYDSALPASTTSLEFFVDGANDGSLGELAKNINTVSDKDLYLGGENWNPARSLIGLMDEARLASVARSDAWLSTEYLTMASNASFTAYEKVVDFDEFAGRMKFQFAYDKGDVLTNFPVLVKFSDGANFRYSDCLSTNGWDLRFTDATGTNLLAYEIESWDTNGTSCVWVRVPEFRDDCVIWAAWGGVGYDVQQAYTTDGTVWSSDYGAVWHLNETSGTHSDASVHTGRDLVVAGAYTQDAVGIIAGGDYGTGGANTERLEPSVPGDGYWHDGFTYRTVSAWVTLDSTTGPNIVYEEGGGTTGMTIGFRTGSKQFILSVSVSGSEVELSSVSTFDADYNQPIHVVGVYDAGEMSLYVDGVLEASGTHGSSAVTSHGDNPAIGGCTGGSSLDRGSAENETKWHGTIDEVRVSDVGRSSNWVWASYQNVAEYDAFVTASPQVRADDATAVAASASTANGELVWTSGVDMDVTLYYGTVDAGATAVGWAASQSVGTGLSARADLASALSGLAPDTTYYYRYYATDGSNEAWSEPVVFHTLIADVPGLSLWVSAEAILDVTNGGTVGTWHDLSGNGNDLTRHDGTPVLVTNAVNGRAVVRFDGNDNNFFDFNRISDIRTVVWVASEDEAAAGARCLLGDTSASDFAREAAGALWGAGASASVLGGRTELNGMAIDGTATLMPTNLAVITLRTTGDVQANLLSKDQGTAGTCWQGDIAEVLVFNRKLTAAEVNELGAALCTKYGVEQPAFSSELDPADFAEHMTISFPGYDRSGSLTDFPALIVLGEHLDGFNYADVASTNGYDLRFTDSSGTNVIPHEIEQWGGAIAAPVAAWTFNGNVTDVSVAGNGYDGALQGSATYSSDTPYGGGQALSLNEATTDYVSIPGYKGVTGTNPRTLAAWVKGPAQDDCIMSWGTDSGGQKWIMRVNLQGSPAIPGALRLEVSSGYVIGTTLLTDGAWHHVAAVFPEGGANVLDVELYVDGTREPVSDSLAFAVNTASVDDVRIGLGHQGKYFTGLIDDAAIWDVALSAPEIAALYNSGKSADLAAPLWTPSYVWVQVPTLDASTTIDAYWGNAGITSAPPFSAVEGMTWDSDFLSVVHLARSGAADSTANGIGGVVTGCLGSGGTVGGGLSFDGADDMVNYGDVDALDAPGYFTFSGWFKRCADNAGTALDSNHEVNNILIGQSSNADNDNFELGTEGGNIELYLDTGSNASVDDIMRTYNAGIVNGNWYHVAFVYDKDDTAADVKLYVDGEFGTSWSEWHDNWISSLSSALSLGVARPADQAWGDLNGVMDEVRLSTAPRSADWVWAEYQTMANNASFTKYGTSLDPAEYAHKMQIVFDGYDGASTLTDFPVLVTFADDATFQYADCQSVNGWDLRFTDSTGTNKLDFEIESWDPAGTSYVWVRVPTLNASTAIWAYWGGADKGGVDPSTADTWSDDHSIVWHLSEPDAADSTRNARDGTSGGNVDATGLIGTAQEFSDDTLTQDYATTYTAYTLSIWVKAATGGQALYSSVFNSGNTGHAFQFDVDGTTPGSYRYYGDEANGKLFGTESVKVGDWILATIACDGTTTKLYYNGVEALSFTASDNVFGRVQLGQNRGGGKYFNGTYDEFRVASAYRSADYIFAMYENVARPGEFMTRRGMVGVGPATDIDVATATANGTLVWDGGLSTDVTVLWGPRDGGAALGAWANTNALGAQAVGSVPLPLSGLTADTTYYYRYYASNTAGVAWSEAVSFHTRFGNIPGLELWVSADAIGDVPDGGTVTTWRDISGNDNHLRLWGDNPLLVTNGPNGQAVVRFDGADEEHYVFNRISNIRTVIWVIKEDSGASGDGFLLGDNGTRYDFHRDTAAGNIWSSGNAAVNVRNGSTVLNGVEVDGTVTPMPNDLSIITLVTAGNVQANTFVNDRFIDGRAWNGDVAELMIFNRALSVGELNELGAHLSEKYGLTTPYTATELDPADFAYRMKISFDGYTGTSTLTNFPVLVRLGEHLNGFSYEGFQSTDGMDIRFTDATETHALSFDIEEWNTNGYSTMWVRVPELNAATYIWAYWGNPTAASSPPFDYGTGVWDGDYDGVWHMRSSLLDATSHDIDGTGSNLTSVAGMVSDGQDMNGFTSVVVLNSDARLEHAYNVTVEAWIQNDTCSGVQRVFYKNPGYSFGINGTKLRFTTHNVKDYDSAALLSPGVWYHAAAVMDSGYDVTFYLNGQAQGTVTHTAAGQIGASTAYLGRWDTQLWSGLLDEVRVSGTARSADWVEATYATVASNTTFTTYQPFITADSATSVDASSATLNGTLNFDDGTATTVTLCYGTVDQGATNTGWDVVTDLGVQGLGAFSAPISGLDEHTTYYFRFYGSNDTIRGWSGVQAFRTAIDGLSGVALWLDADQVEGVGAGQPVNVWHDLSGYGRHAVQLVSDRKPSLAAGVLNGRDAVRFAAGDTMDLLGPVTAAGGTVFIIHRQDEFQSAVTHVLGGTLNTTQDDQQWALDADGGAIDIFPPIASTEFSLNVMQLVPGYFRLWINGTREDPSTANVTVDPLSAVGYDFEGDVVEVVVFDHALTVDEQSTMGGYLADKYGLDTTYRDRVLDPNAFNYRVAIDYGYDKGDTLTNFPALVTLNATTVPDFDKNQFASTAGHDLRFTDETGTNALNYEVEELLREVPVAYYRFDNSAVDGSTAGNNYSGVPQGDADYTNDVPPGATGYSLDLTGTNGYVTVPSWKGIGGRRARTISAWIKLPPSSPTNAAIVTWGQNAPGEKWCFRVQDSNGTSGAIRLEENENYEVGVTPVNDGNWHHVAVVLHEGGNGGVDPVLFVDGQLEADSATRASKTMWTDVNDGIVVTIGNDHNNNRFKGLIDDVAIWEACLTPEQILTVYNGGSPLDVSGGLENDEMIAWVQVPAFTNNCRIYAYWGNESAGNKPPFYAGNSAVWDERFEGVYHMSSRDPQDQTVYARHQSNSGELTYTNGIVHVAQSCPGDAYGTVAVDAAYANYSVSVWCKASTVPLVVNRSTFNCGSNLSDFQFDSDGSGIYRLATDVGNANFGPNTTDWVNLVMTADQAANRMRVYYNGRYSGQVNGFVNNFDRFDIGANRGRDKCFTGSIDEVRVMNETSSSNWIWASYMMIASNDLFGTTGTLDGPAPALTNLAPILVTDDSATFRGYLSVTDDTPTHVWMVWDTADHAWGDWPTTNDFGGGLVSGALATNIAGLAETQPYYYAFYGSNVFGETYAQPSMVFTTLASLFYTITPTSTLYGAIAPDYPENLSPGAKSSTYTFSADPGFHLTNVMMTDGVAISNLGAVASCVITNVNTNWTIEAQFGINQYTISVVQASGGTIAPAGDSYVDYTNDSPVFTIMPERGYFVRNVMVDATPQGPAATYRFENVTAGHTLSAQFDAYPDWNFPSNSMALWLDAEKITASDGQRLAIWRDYSGHGGHMYQAAAASRPEYKTGVLNGNPVVRFDMVRLMTNASLHAAWPVSNATVYAVYKAASPNNNRLYTMRPELAHDRFLLHLPNGGNTYFDYGWWDSPTNGRIQTVFDGGTDGHIWAMRNAYGTGQWLWRDGTLRVSDTSPGVLNTAGKSFEIGSGVDGDLAELLIFNEALDFADDARVGHYLQTKYGIAGDYVDPHHIDLGVAVTCDALYPSPTLDTFTYTLTVTNNGPTNATAIVITNTFPAGVAYVSDDGGGTFDDGSNLWTPAGIPYQGSATLTITCSVAAGTGDALLTNTVSVVSTGEIDWNAANDSASVAFRVGHETLVPGDFLRRMKITFPGYTKAETLTNFPVLVKLSEALPGFRYEDFVSPTGGDLRFADSGGQVALGHEIEVWNPAGTSYVWVCATTLEVGTEIWACWGNAGDAGAPGYTTNGLAWRGDGLIMTHMQAGSGADSTTNALNGAVVDAVSAGGMVAGGLSFDGNNDYVTYGDVDQLDSPRVFTSSLWFRRRTEGSDGAHGINNVLVSQAHSTDNDNIEFGTSGANIEFYIDDKDPDGNPDSIPGGIQDDTWHYLTLTYDAAAVNEASWYVDGVLVSAFDTQGDGTGLYPSAGSPLGLGMSRVTTTQTGDFDGLMDEFRMDLAARSSNWVWACYHNQNGATYDSFVSVEEAVGPPVIENRQAIDISRTVGTMRGYLTSTGGAPSSVWLYWGETDGLDDRAAWGNTNGPVAGVSAGWVTNRLTTLEAGTAYFFRYFASNTYGMAWASPTTNLQTAASNEFAITAVAGDFGSVVPSGTEFVTNGADSATYNFYPQSGYQITNVVVDGGSVGTPAGYQFTNVQTDHTLTVYFGIQTYDVTVTQSAGGTITPDPHPPIEHGSSSQPFAITAAEGYYLWDVTVDGESVGQVYSYTFSNVTNDHTIAAVFSNAPALPVQDGAVLWLSSETLNATNAASILLWKDLTTNHHDVAQVDSALAPSFVTNALNGKPALYFDRAAGQYLRRADSLGFSGDPALSIVVVVTAPSGNVYSYIQLGDIEGAAGKNMTFCTDAAVRYSDGNRQFYNDGQSGAHSIGIWTRNAGDQYNEPVFWKNGKLANQTGEDNNPGNLHDGGLDDEDTVIGAGRNTSGNIQNALGGQLVELIVYNRAITAEERRQVGRYLGAKYDIGTGYGAELLPPDVDDPLLWLDANAIYNVTNNQPIATWNDLSGHGNDVIQGTAANQPLFKTDVFHGMPGVRFDGANDYLRRGDSLGLFSDPSMTVVAVLRDEGIGEDSRFLHMGDSDGTDTKTLGFSCDSSVRYNGGNVKWLDHPLRGEYHIGLFSRVAGDNYGAPLFYRDGLLIAKTAETSPTKLLTGWSNEDCVVGAGRNNTGAIPSNLLKGELLELLVYGRTLTPEQQQVIGNYLMQKYKMLPSVFIVR